MYIYVVVAVVATAAAAVGFVEGKISRGYGGEGDDGKVMTNFFWSDEPGRTCTH